MNTYKLSRRRLLGGFLAVLAAWLCPRPRHAAVESHRADRVVDPQPSQYMHSGTYTYDSMGRLVHVTEYLPRPIEPSLHCVPITREHGGTFIFYG